MAQMGRPRLTKWSALPDGRPKPYGALESAARAGDHLTSDAPDGHTSRRPWTLVPRSHGRRNVSAAGEQRSLRPATLQRPEALRCSTQRPLYGRATVARRGDLSRVGAPRPLFPLARICRRHAPHSGETEGPTPQHRHDVRSRRILTMAPDPRSGACPAPCASWSAVKARSADPRAKRAGLTEGAQRRAHRRAPPGARHSSEPPQASPLTKTVATGDRLQQSQPSPSQRHTDSSNPLHPEVPHAFKRCTPAWTVEPVGVE